MSCVIYSGIACEIISYYPLANEVAKGYSNIIVLPQHPCEHSRINILPWILTKLGTYLVLQRIWNPSDFQGQRSPSQIFRRGGMSRFALPLFLFVCLLDLFWVRVPLQEWFVVPFQDLGYNINKFTSLIVLIYMYQ